MQLIIQSRLAAHILNKKKMFDIHDLPFLRVIETSQTKICQFDLTAVNQNQRKKLALAFELTVKSFPTLFSSTCCSAEYWST